MKKNYIFLFYFVFILISTNLAATERLSLSITGTVKQPLNLSIDDLCSFKTSRVQLNEVLKDGSYRGAWFYNGVPLRILLETAYIEKEETAFSNPIDLAILVRDRDGKEVALSWGEIFFKNSGDIIIASSATPIKPHHSCNSCHNSEVSDRYMKQFDREIGFPKLVVGSDGYADRSIENVVSIEVVNPAPCMPVDKSAKLFSPSFVVTGDVKKETVFDDISEFPRKDINVIHMGEGKGYHGTDDYSGVLFNDVITKAGVEPDLSKIFHISAPDGYRTTFSYGEIFLNRVEDNTIIADIRNGKKIENGGRFIFVPSDDLMSDRDIKSVSRIEVIDLKRKPRLTFIGVGCADTDLITMEAITAMSRADIFVCPPDIKKRFGKYMGDKPILLDIFDFAPPAIKKKYPQLSPDALNNKMQEKRLEAINLIRAELDKGKNVSILDYGDLTVWSGSEYIRDYFDDKIIDIIPGLSSFNVASAMVKSHTGCNGSIILTNSGGILANKELFRAAAKNGETLCVFMAIRDIQELVEFLKEAYNTPTPVHIVYRAGYSGSEKVVRTNLDGLTGIINEENEKHLFLLFIGPCLDAAKARRH